MNVLQISNLSKNYGNIKALNGLNLSIEKGQIFGILGPNGSGKTTTLGIILNILQASSGSFVWFENQFSNPRLKIGAILETPNFLPYLNAEDNLKIVAKIKNSTSDDFQEYLRIVNLDHRKTSKFSTYSLGMKQRLAIAATMIGNPDVLIFDEPTNGLDPQGIAEVRNILTNIAAMNKTVIMASHILDEVEKICSHVAIIKNGKLLASGSVGSILSDDIMIEVSAPNIENLKRVLSSMPGIKNIIEDNGVLQLNAEKEITALVISKKCLDENICLTHLVERKQRLEEEFLEITKNA